MVLPIIPQQPYAPLRIVCRTPGISCERPIRSTLVCFIDGMDSSNDSVGIDVPESLLYRQGGAHPCRTILS
jgi:hypothetical protein